MEGEVLITLPSGTYVPEFRRVHKPGHSATTVELNTAELSNATPSSRLRLLPAKTAVRIWLVAGLGLFAIAGLSLHKVPASKLLWAPILEAADPILVVTETWRPSHPAVTQTDASLPGVTDRIDPKTFLFIHEQTAKLTSFLLENGKRLDYELARDVSVSKLRAKPFILRGAFNNPWTIQSVSTFRFYFQFDRTLRLRRIVDRENPDRRDWVAPAGQALTEDYALIARAPQPPTGQMMLVIAGLGEQASAAALEFATNRKYLERFAAGAPGGWAKRNVELVLQTKLVHGDWGEPHVVASYFW